MITPINETVIKIKSLFLNLSPVNIDDKIIVAIGVRFAIMP
jgi:hypothetical protein